MQRLHWWLASKDVLCYNIRLTSTVFDDSEFVTCMQCDDYDLCLLCHIDEKHGHHPNHTFAPASESTVLDARAIALCSPGRNVRHLAICDGCDKVSNPVLAIVIDTNRGIDNLRRASQVYGLP